MLPCFLCDPCPELLRAGPPLEPTRTGIWNLTHPDMRGAARVAALSDFLFTEIKQRERLLGGQTPGLKPPG